ncbi:35260_t:CDS:2 [Gigaspora margarita]|uniref:35260_t:CDS:1 n=1 Tax=Gigaspora margarita TaxID=4874 RepID=A0ABN7VVR4_GIGMA|nr:35260_t:CDS:2 [Gigaspora margarita]
MEFYESLSTDFNQLLEESDDYDMIIYVGKEPNVKKFYAHTVILRARSTYFRRALSRDWAKKENGSIVFQKPNITKEVFLFILKYIYTGVADLHKQDGEIILNILTASDELNLHELIAYAQDHLIQEKSDWLQKNVVQVLHTVASLEACKDLQDFCLGMICQDPYWLLESDNFCALEESVLVPLLKRDDLLMEEIEIWNRLIEWGIAQIPSIDGNISNWTQSDFEVLKSTLEPCIPLIRYFHIDSADYYDKVRPFEHILPSKLREDILQYYLKKGNIGQLDSVILPPRMPGIEFSTHATEGGWMSAAAPPWSPHRRRPSLNITRSTYDVGPYQSSHDSFLFSLGDGKNLENAKLSRISPENASCAVFSSQYHGPCFGQTDLRMNDNFNSPSKCTCQRHDYETEICELQNFSVEEYEVFQVVDKNASTSSQSPSDQTYPTSFMHPPRPESTNYPTSW